ncbi:MAG: hypothetical protein ACPGPI_01990 [Longimicrobiales bacterium]
MSQERIRSLVENNPGQASAAEYMLVHGVIATQAPCNLLVFGVGRDSSLWVDTNKGGHTVFVEDIKMWADYARNHVDGITVIDVRYWTIRIMWSFLRFIPSLLHMRSLPVDILETEWDVILVDGPRGTRWYRRGRMMSIYTASVLAKRSRGKVFVHDCHRSTEAECSDAFLGADHLVSEVETMRYYALG